MMEIINEPDLMATTGVTMFLSKLGGNGNFYISLLPMTFSWGFADDYNDYISLPAVPVARIKLFTRPGCGRVSMRVNKFD